EESGRLTSEFGSALGNASTSGPAPPAARPATPTPGIRVDEQDDAEVTTTTTSATLTSTTALTTLTTLAIHAGNLSRSTDLEACPRGSGGAPDADSFRPPRGLGRGPHPAPCEVLAVHASRLAEIGVDYTQE
ncbi:unnamed protein product, partial [Prorocentrum cordatum]